MLTSCHDSVRKGLRWICRHTHRTATVRLIDDTGFDSPPAVRFCTFQNPLDFTELEPRLAFAGFPAEAPGGLFVAIQGAHTDAFVLSAPQTGNSLQVLLVNPRFLAPADDVNNTASALRLLLLWSNAHVAGPLATNRRDHVTRGILGFVYGALTGHDWSQVEGDYLAAPRAEHSQDRLTRSVGGPPAFAVILRRDYRTIAEDTATGERWFAELAERYKVCSNPALSSFALRLASCPSNVFAMYKENLQTLFTEIKRVPTLLRGARLLALLSANDTTDATTSMLPSWTWR